MNLNTLLTLLPVSVWIALGVSVVIPALSAAVVKEHWDASITGAITLALSTAAGFLTQWGAAGDGFEWKAALGTALLSWLVAMGSQSKILSGTALESWLLSLRSSAPQGPGSPDPTVGIDPAPETSPETSPEAAPEPAAAVAADAPPQTATA